MNSLALDHENISPTAKLVAYWRKFSDIPYSQDIASLFNTEEVFKDKFVGLNDDDQENNALAAFLELRYKSILHEIKKSAIKQVLEFASGISLRGLSMTEDKTITYVETDLPLITKEKIKVVKSMMEKHRIAGRENLFFYEANILNPGEIENATAHFRADEPIAIINEGLFQYLTKEEKKKAAQNILSLLKKYGGIWLTPDLETKEQIHDHPFDKDRYRNFFDMVERSTGRNFKDNAFKDEEELVSFFEDLGFSIEWLPQLDQGISLSCLEKRPISKKAKEALSKLRLYKLTAES